MNKKTKINPVGSQPQVEGENPSGFRGDKFKPSWKTPSLPSEDTEVLDWLLQQNGGIIYCGKWGWKCETPGGLKATGRTVREAIDAMRGKTKEKE
jgi:hypothetical protein